MISWQPNVSYSHPYVPLKISSQLISVSLPARMSVCTLADPPSTCGLHSPSLAIRSSIPRLTGSAMPNVLRSISIFSESWVACQFASRASRGCFDFKQGAWSLLLLLLNALLDDENVSGARDRLVRRVSWMPGTDGAPLTSLVLLVYVCFGTKLRDYGN